MVSVLAARCRFAGAAPKADRPAAASSAAPALVRVYGPPSPRAAASSGRTTGKGEARADNSQSSNPETDNALPKLSEIPPHFPVQTYAPTAAGKERRGLSDGWDAQTLVGDVRPIPSTALGVSCAGRSPTPAIAETQADPALCRAVSEIAHEFRATEMA